MKSIWLIVLLVITLAVGGAYLTNQSMQESVYTPLILHLGVLPDQDDESLRARYSPLLDYLTEEVGLEVELVVASDYSHLRHLFKNKEVDMARFGGLGFVQANTFYDAEPLVMRDIDTRFVSWFLVRANSDAQNIADFKGKTFSFGSQLSTSGHIMPRYFLRTNQHVVPEEFFSRVDYAAAHDKTVYSILNNEVDLGVVNPVIVKAMIEDGRLKEDTLRLLWETPPYPDYVWTVHSTLNSELKTKLRNTFLALDILQAKHKNILNNLGCTEFLPAGVHDFKLLQEVAASLGLLDSSAQ